MKGSRKDPQKTVLRVEYEDIRDPENELRCSGIAILVKNGVEAAARCTKPHPHQERRKVITYSDGTSATEIVGPGWSDKFKTDVELGGEPWTGE